MFDRLGKRIPQIKSIKIISVISNWHYWNKDIQDNGHYEWSYQQAKYPLKIIVIRLFSPKWCRQKVVIHFPQKFSLEVKYTSKIEGEIISLNASSSQTNHWSHREMCWDQRTLELTLGSGILTSKNDFGYKTHMNRVLLFRPRLYKYRTLW